MSDVERLAEALDRVSFVDVGQRMKAERLLMPVVDAIARERAAAVEDRVEAAIKQHRNLMGSAVAAALRAALRDEP